MDQNDVESVTNVIKNNPQENVAYDSWFEPGVTDHSVPESSISTPLDNSGYLF